MKKTLLTLLACTMLAVSVAGCSSPDSAVHDAANPLWRLPKRFRRQQKRLLNRSLKQLENRQPPSLLKQFPMTLLIPGLRLPPKNHYASVP